ncbi:patatin-like phospholipase family protein [Thalassotalea agariperforans]
MPNKNSYINSKHGLVLTGGGARAAYQVGALSAITKFIPRNHGIPFPVICGTSAGAINSTALACYASCFHLGVKKLEWFWKNLKTNKIYCSDGIRAFGHIFSGMLASFQADYANKTARSLLNNAPLRALLNAEFNYRKIDENIIKGYLSAISITASSYSSGDSISFYHGNNDIKPWQRAKRIGKRSRINSDILLASSAIPLVFPSVKINREHYGDGSIHQLSPLSPAIHLGAEKLLIIGVEQPKEPMHQMENNPHPPTTSTIAGHLLDTIFADTLQSDLERMNRINDTLSLINNEDKKTHSLKQIDSLVLNPSHDFNNIAVDYFYDLPLSIRILLRSIGITNDSDSSLVSYLLFEKRFCQHLIQLGFEDTMAKEAEIRAFLSL